ncbi:MAG: DUF4062 domain-containing protein [Candidatus Lokiarchaeota archaeon]|nr:DUF4062 domain-containing protein [Candidatus Lokiarchaeota archaeon]
MSSTFRDLAEPRANILDKLDTVFEGVGMEEFIPDGSNSQEVCIRDLKKSDIVIFLISPYYGTLMDTCSLISECKADCPMKTGKGCISYTHCEYKNTISEGILHQTYLVEKGWDAKDLKKEALEFRDEIGKEMWKGIQDVNDTSLVKLICNNLAKRIIEWHTLDILNFQQFCDREEIFNELINNIDGKVEVYGVGGIGKTALIQVALLIQKLKGKKIISIGIPKSYASGSGFESFRLKCKNDQYIAVSQKEITINDVINALAGARILFDPEEFIKKPKNELVELLAKKLRNEENLTVFIDDFHLATKDVVNLVKSLDNIILSSRKNTYIAKTEICVIGVDEEDREDLIKIYSREELPKKVKDIIKKISEGHPLSTELLVKNYQNINFEKLKDFNLEYADDKQVKDFYKRVIEEIYSSNKKALVLLKNLAVINTDLKNNINREVVYQSYEIDDVKKYFKELVDTGMLKKREGKEETYEFQFVHIQDALEDIASHEYHLNAVKYYNIKNEIVSKDINNRIESLYHKIISNPSENLIDEFLIIVDNQIINNYGLKRLIDCGKNLKRLINENYKRDMETALKNLYSRLEAAYMEELMEHFERIRRDPIEFISTTAVLLTAIGENYAKIGSFEKAEKEYQRALKIYKKISRKKPALYKPKIAMLQKYLGNLYFKFKRFKKAEKTFHKALEIDSNDSEIWYSKSCVESLMKSKEKALASLLSAIKLDKKYIEMAKSNSDFEYIKTSKEFKKLIED